MSSPSPAHVPPSAQPHERVSLLVKLGRFFKLKVDKSGPPSGGLVWWFLAILVLLAMGITTVWALHQADVVSWDVIVSWLALR